MNKFLLLFIVILLIRCGQSDTSTYNASQKLDKLPQYTKKVKAINLNLSIDSGYIKKDIGLPFLIENNLTDTIDGMWEKVLATDTIGKFYKMTNNNYLICIHDLGKDSEKGGWRTHIICEVKQNNDTSKLEKYERYFHGMYPGCWSNHYIGFYKVGDYFCFDGCITGSCFNGTMTYYFKELENFKGLNSINTNLFECGDEVNFRRVSSKRNIDETIITLYYLEEIGKIDYSNSTREFKTNKIFKFQMKYYFKNGNWILKDSTYWEKVQF
jgi:hypothetical protein